MIKYWRKTLLLTGFYQALLQGLGFISGIIIIRVLSVEEYALYTLANAGLGFMAAIADSGISAGVMSQGGKVWNRNAALGKIILTAMRLRQKFGIFSFLVLSPCIYYLMTYKGNSSLLSLLTCLAMLPVFFAGLTTKIFEIAPKLHQHVDGIQKVSIAVNSLRALGIALLLPVFPFAYTAVLLTGVIQTLANFVLRKINKKYIDLHATPSQEIESSLIKIMKRALPSAIYFGLSGQLVIWLVAAFGTTANIAEVGALTRITIIFSILANIFIMIFVPRFAKLPDKKGVLVRRFIQLQGALFLIGATIPVFVWMFPQQILFILGDSYKSLSKELIILGCTTGLHLVINGLSSINASRAYILHPAIHIPFNLSVLIVLIILVKPDTTENALLLDFFRAAIAPLILNFTFFRYVKKPRYE